MEKFYNEYYPQDKPNINPKETSDTEDYNYSPEGQLSAIQDNKTEITSLINSIDRINNEIEELEKEIVEIQTDDNFNSNNIENLKEISKREHMIEAKRNVIDVINSRIIALKKENNFIVRNN